MKLKQTLCFSLCTIMLCLSAGCIQNKSDIPQSPIEAGTQAPVENNRITPTPVFEENIKPTAAPTPEEKEPVILPELLHSGVRVVVDGLVHTMDIYEQDGHWYLTGDDVKTLFSDAFTEEFVSLDQYAETKNIRYTQDELLTAAYFNTWEPYRTTGVDLTLFDSYITALQLSTEKAGQETISGMEMAELLDSFVAYAAPKKLEDWKTLYPAFRSHNRPLNRLDTMASIFLAVQHIGGTYTNLEYTIETVNQEMMSVMMKDDIFPSFTLFGNTTYDLGVFSYDHCGVGAVVYNLSNYCSIDGSYPLGYDMAEDSFHIYDNATYAEAMAALLRVVATRSGGYVSIDDPAAVTLSGCLTAEHIAKAQSNPAFTAENHPILQGFIGGMEYSGGAASTSPEDILKTANWGFNAYCFKFDYVMLFDENVTTVNLNNFAYLDSLIAAAIENNVHLCLVTTTLPGRWASHSTDDYTSAGEFDLFINPEKQELANRVWQIIARRYKDIPSANLSFWPTWEAANMNLSTGLPTPDYTRQDAADYMSIVTDIIRAEDPDRMVTFEVEKAGDIAINSAPYLPVSSEKGNMQILTDFGEIAFSYAAMTGEEGAHIDNNNHSISLPEYPTYYYELGHFVDLANPLVFDGFLPEGTIINIYLSFSDHMTLDFYADDTLFHSEKLEEAQYNVGYPLTGLMPFATSDKMISVTLSKTAEKVTVIPSEDFCFSWCGIEIILPKEYAQKKWYDITAYDVFLGVEEKEGLTLRETSSILIYPTMWSEVHTATIHEDLRFTTSKRKEEHADSESINSYLDSMAAVNSSWLVRYEDATFSAMIWEEVKEYYIDILDGFSRHNFSWLSNDWDNITKRSPGSLAGSSTVEYMGYSHFNLELLQLLQSYQN